ncbi:MAG: hypothetical protein GC152_10985 [Alphaproteobacteria bacterium]|nr:hypothetical protein [Alphaproteobacteria bacterium]
MLAPARLAQGQGGDMQRTLGKDGAQATARRLVGVGRFVANRRGAAAVEFAIVAPVFFMLLFSILEAGIYFFISSSVDAANAKASRLIRTGQTQDGAISRDAFFDEVCEVVSHFGDCDARLTVDVERYDNFADLAADIANPVCRDSDPSAGEPDPADRPYQSGGARDIVRVRICYLYDSFNPAIGFNLKKADGGAHKMISTSVFRNEPFGG